uniref:Uncharacterized protein n=1 Tax=Anguilla anguilla TaxID=7936 RepID=A0A0E9TG41_ANGAN
MYYIHIWDKIAFCIVITHELRFLSHSYPYIQFDKC